MKFKLFIVALILFLGLNTAPGVEARGQQTQCGGNPHEPYLHQVNGHWRMDFQWTGWCRSNLPGVYRIDSVHTVAKINSWRYFDGPIGVIQYSNQAVNLDAWRDFGNLDSDGWYHDGCNLGDYHSAARYKTYVTFIVHGTYTTLGTSFTNRFTIKSDEVIENCGRRES